MFPGRNDPAKPIADDAFGMALKRMGFEGRHMPLGSHHVVAIGLKDMGYPGAGSKPGYRTSYRASRVCIPMLSI